MAMPDNKEYIEREAVLRRKRKMSGADFGGEFWDEAVLCEDIHRIPAADVAEVRHGVWNEKHGESYLVSPMKYDENGEPILQEYSWYECSLCRRTEKQKEPYCNCGAKMDKE